MRKFVFIFLSLIFPALFAFKSDKPAYFIFDKKGKEAKFKEMIKEASASDVVLFGELHNDPLCHWLELETAISLFENSGDKLVLAAEMFETDNQLLIDEYFTGLIRQKNFEDEAKLWDNYKTDYKPLVEFAKENKLKFIASNVPRRYASMVNKGGFEALDKTSPETKAFLPPLPIPYDPELPGYKGMIKMMEESGQASHATENLPKAQALKDATMAHFIMKNFEPGRLVIHYNGSYHSENFEGIYWYIKNQNPDIKILTITTVAQDTIDSLKEEHIGKADYTICVPANMTKTY